MVASPETTERVVRTYRCAAEANRQTPSRRGNVAFLDLINAEDVVVSADLHGNRANLDRLCEIADLANHPRRHLIMQEVCHGGPVYPTGNGCMSHQLLEHVAALKSQFPEQFHFLMSNHELAELTDFPIVKSNQILNVKFRCGLLSTYGPETERVRATYVDFLRSCPLAVHLSNGIFICHSAPENVDTEPYDASVFHRPLEPADLAPGGAVFRMVWGRDYRQANADAFAKLTGADVLIHGHEPCPDGYMVPNRTQIILDSCGEHGVYVLISFAQRWTQQQIVDTIRPLW